MQTGLDENSVPSKGCTSACTSSGLLSVLKNPKIQYLKSSVPNSWQCVTEGALGSGVTCVQLCEYCFDLGTLSSPFFSNAVCASSCLGCTPCVSMLQEMQSSHLCALLRGRQPLTHVSPARACFSFWCVLQSVQSLEHFENSPLLSSSLWSYYIDI